MLQAIAPLTITTLVFSITLMVTSYFLLKPWIKANNLRQKQDYNIKLSILMGTKDNLKFVLSFPCFLFSALFIYISVGEVLLDIQKHNIKLAVQQTFETLNAHKKPPIEKKNTDKQTTIKKTYSITINNVKQNIPLGETSVKGLSLVTVNNGFAAYDYKGESFIRPVTENIIPDNNVKKSTKKGTFNTSAFTKK